VDIKQSYNEEFPYRSISILSLLRAVVMFVDDLFRLQVIYEVKCQPSVHKRQLKYRRFDPFVLQKCTKSHIKPLIKFTYVKTPPLTSVIDTSSLRHMVINIDIMVFFCIIWCSLDCDCLCSSCVRRSYLFGMIRCFCLEDISSRSEEDRDIEVTLCLSV
jgi:hypothetical protein